MKLYKEFVANILRKTIEPDISVFFVHQLDKDAANTVAFTPKDPNDREAFFAKWVKILSNDEIEKRTIVNHEGEVAGYIVCFDRDGRREVGFWLGREHWGKGLATRALNEFLAVIQRRPLFAGAAKDNLASVRVLEKCGFTFFAHAKDFSNSRNAEVELVILTLNN